MWVCGVWLCGVICATECLWGQKVWGGWFFAFLRVGPGNQTQVLRFDGKSLFSLILVTGPGRPLQTKHFPHFNRELCRDLCLHAETLKLRKDKWFAIARQQPCHLPSSRLHFLNYDTHSHPQYWMGFFPLCWIPRLLSMGTIVSTDIHIALGKGPLFLLFTRKVIRNLKCSAEKLSRN